MRALYLSDDETLALATSDGGSDRLLLPSLVGAEQADIERALFRGSRSLRIRAGDVEHETWTSRLADAGSILARAPRLVLFATDRAGGMAPGAPVTCAYRLEAEAAIEVVDTTGLHAFSIGAQDEINRIVQDTIEAFWAPAETTPADGDRAPIEGLFLRVDDLEYLVQRGQVKARRAREILWHGESIDAVRDDVAEALAASAE